MPAINRHSFYLGPYGILNVLIHLYNKNLQVFQLLHVEYTYLDIAGSKEHFLKTFS